MPKKPRSARRKNGLAIGDENDINEVDALSDTYTITDSIATDAQSIDDSFYEYYEEDEEVEDAITSSTLRNTKLQDALSQSSVMTTEKRKTKRESNLKLLFKAITQYATGSDGRDTVYSRLDDVIFPICTVGLRYGGTASPAEQYAACRVLEATSIVLGGDMDEYCERVYELLRKVVNATGLSSQVRGAALRAMSMAHFICASDLASTYRVLDLCEKLCLEKYRGEVNSASLRSTALDCWALLSTTLHDADVSGETVHGNGRGIMILNQLFDCLNSASLDLRRSAGECMALIHEVRLNLGLDDDEGENVTERQFCRGNWEDSECEVIVDEIKQKVAELSVESSHSISKKAKKEQRANFREIFATVVEDEAPDDIIEFRGMKFEFHSWREIVQANFIRHCLQGGFQMQLMTNPTMSCIFSVDNITTKNMSQLEKRLFRSKTSEASKAADKHMARRRRSRLNAQNHFLSADGEDI